MQLLSVNRISETKLKEDRLYQRSVTTALLKTLAGSIKNKSDILATLRLPTLRHWELKHETLNKLKTHTHKTVPEQTSANYTVVLYTNYPSFISNN